MAHEVLKAGNRHPGLHRVDTKRMAEIMDSDVVELGGLGCSIEDMLCLPVGEWGREHGLGRSTGIGNSVGGEKHGQGFWNRHVSSRANRLESPCTRLDREPTLGQPHITPSQRYGAPRANCLSESKPGISEQREEHAPGRRDGIEEGSQFICR